jgi:hypothetical protein
MNQASQKGKVCQALQDLNCASQPVASPEGKSSVLNVSRGEKKRPPSAPRGSNLYLLSCCSARELSPVKLGEVLSLATLDD